jgi:hypothetical protein
MNAALAFAPDLDDEHAAALQRFDEDLVRALGDVPDREQRTLLRRRACDAYRTALASAAGRPDDPLWSLLAAVTATVLAALGPVSSPSAGASVRRLRALADDR